MGTLIQHAMTVCLSNLNSKSGFCFDLFWFIRFLKFFNGVVSFRHNSVILSRIFGHYINWTRRHLGNHVYAARIPETLQSIYSITHYEMFNFVVAVKACGRIRWFLLDMITRVRSVYARQGKSETCF